MAKFKTVVLDTNVLIYFFAGNENAGQIIQQYIPSISTTTKIELLSGKRQSAKERELTKDFLDGLSPIQTTPSVSNLAIKFRLSYNRRHYCSNCKIS